ncbi:MAG TPA: thiamine phosphate synthase [Bacillales bacterium]
MRDFKLYVITDERFHPGRNLFEVIEEAMAGGADIVQLRDKKSSKKEVLEKARELRRLTERYGVQFIVNDYIDVAMAVDADGIHLGQDDLPLEEARRILGAEKIIGISTHSLEQAKEAESGGGDYIGVGPVFSTGTKEDVVDPVTPHYVREAAANIKIPFVAIGGIKLHNVDQVLNAGAKRICAVSEIVGSFDVAGTCRQFLKKINQAGRVENEADD